MEQRDYRILVVENQPDDAELVIEQLRRDAIEPTWRRVSSAEELQAALGEHWDVVLSDFVMPGFSGTDALRIVKASGLDLPFIIVSGSVDERVGVEAMKAGAHDFFRKDRLGHLAAAVEREVREARVRRESARVEAALRHIEELHRLTLESIKDVAIFNLDLQGRVSTWHPGVARVHGYSAEEFIGMPYERLLTPEDVQHGVAEHHMRMARTEGRCQDEGWRVRKGGRHFWAEVTVTPLLDAAGTLRGYTKVVRDTSERKRLVDELKVAVQVRDEFLSVAAHELRTPLTSLKLQLQSAQRVSQGVAEDEHVAPLVKKLEAALRHTSRVAELVENLLDVSRITSGRMEVRRESIDVAELVREIAARLEGIRSASGSPLRIKTDGASVGELDRMRFETVVTNLLSNALKFGEGKPVDVLVSSANGILRLVVKDRGIGISPENQARIFQRFERAVSEAHYGGFGIGLWIVRQVVEAHGGTVTVRSAPGEGAEFTVELPSAAA